MKLSVIVPVYKAENTLRECLDSLKNQHFDDFEVIMINDGSPDDSQAIIEEYAAAQPEVFRFLVTENGGQGRARNLAIDMARGDWLGFVDSDDWIQPDMFAHMIAQAEREGADLVVCDQMKCMPDGSTERMHCWRDSKRMASVGSVTDILVRREILGDAIRFPEGLWYEDFALSAKLLMRVKKPVNLPEVLYYYRSGLPSTMNNENARRNLDLIKILEIIRADMVENGWDLEDFNYLLINSVLVDAINRLARQHNSERRNVMRQLRDYARGYIPDLTACKSFQEEKRNRRIVMWLNYHGLEGVSKTLLAAKHTLFPGIQR